MEELKEETEHRLLCNGESSAPQTPPPVIHSHQLGFTNATLGAAMPPFSAHKNLCTNTDTLHENSEAVDELFDSDVSSPNSAWDSDLDGNSTLPSIRDDLDLLLSKIEGSNRSPRRYLISSQNGTDLHLSSHKRYKSATASQFSTNVSLLTATTTSRALPPTTTENPDKSPAMNGNLSKNRKPRRPPNASNNTTSSSRTAVSNHDGVAASSVEENGFTVVAVCLCAEVSFPVE